jgi:hypothetical protein
LAAPLLLSSLSGSAVTRAAGAKLEGVRSVQVVRRDEPLFIEPSKGASRRGAAGRGARLPVFEIARGGGCTGRWFSVGPLAWICEEGAEASSASPPPERARDVTADGLPYAYYFVGADGSFGYGDLLVAEEGVPETQLLPGFGVAITREGQKPGGERYGLDARLLDTAARPAARHGAHISWQRAARRSRRGLGQQRQGAVAPGAERSAWA